MTCDVYNGGNTVLEGQIETAYRTLPGTPNSLKLKFSEFSFARNPARQEDPTIDGSVLAQKTDEVDESPSGTLTSIACLNDMTFWLHLLIGAPVTTGTGPGPYVHTYTLTRNCRPSALLQANMRTSQSAMRYRRFLGAMVNSLNWDVLADDQNISLDLLIATQPRPFPVAAFDTTPTSLPKQRAAAANCSIYDVLGANTLGVMTGCSIAIENGLEGIKQADGRFGYGDVLMGDPKISGTLRALFRDGTIADFGEAHTTKKLVIATTSLDGAASCTITLPSVEFSEPAVAVSTKSGLVVETNWMAHAKAGDAPVTIVLTNSTPALVI